MQATDRMAFAAMLGTLAEVFGEPLSDTRVEAYFRALSDLPLDAMKLAGERVIRTARWFPKPVEFREAVEGSPEERTEAAWLALVEEARQGSWHSPVFQDGLAADAIEAVFGSWPAAVDAFCELSEPAWQAKRKEFLAASRVLARRKGTRRPAMLSGMFARQNALSGWTPERVAALEGHVQAALADISGEPAR